MRCLCLCYCLVAREKRIIRWNTAGRNSKTLRCEEYENIVPVLSPRWVLLYGKEVIATNISTDKARYNPGDTVRVMLEHTAGFTQPQSLTLTIYAPGSMEREEQTVACDGEDDARILRFSWQPPAADFTGYLLGVSAVSADGETLYAEIAADVSSAWVKFPRYGYLWDFTEHADAESKVAALNRYHLNGLEYYDWQYRHHIPLSPDLDKWQDWSGRWIYGSVLRRYIAAAKARNIVSMAYDMIYAANKTYKADGSGVDPAWRLIKADGEDFTCEMSRELGDTGVLQYFNPLNEGWQAYIFPKITQALDTLGFDGWHGDTIGEYGEMTTADGQPLGLDEQGNAIRLVKDCYTIFLNKAKAALGGRYLSFNPVGAQGIEKVSVSKVDVLYSEFWPWETSRWGAAFDSYYALQQEIFDAAKLSGGKSLILATYVNYRAPQSTFNAPAVRLLDAVTYASGGARIALGNGEHMLSDEYFPSDGNKTMDARLRQKTVAMYDFITAYQNLLRGGQTPVSRTVALKNARQTVNGQSDAVWTFAMAGGGCEVLHCINLTGTDNLWRDERQTKPEPQFLQNVRIRYYTDFDFSSLCFASPDGESLAPQALDYRIGHDRQGRYIECTLRLLQYWTMVFMR